jgi:hypothetical protein
MVDLYLHSPIRLHTVVLNKHRSTISSTFALNLHLLALIMEELRMKFEQNLSGNSENISLRKRSVSHLIAVLKIA